jgi:hypothetical protein
MRWSVKQPVISFMNRFVLNFEQMILLLRPTDIFCLGCSSRVTIITRKTDV